MYCEVKNELARTTAVPFFGARRHLILSSRVEALIGPGNAAIKEPRDLHHKIAREGPAYIAR